jgi:hypothetical protein
VLHFEQHNHFIDRPGLRLIELLRYSPRDENACRGPCGGKEGNEGQYIECAEHLKLMYNNSEESERSGLKSTPSRKGVK